MSSFKSRKKKKKHSKEEDGLDRLLCEYLFPLVCSVCKSAHVTNCGSGRIMSTTTTDQSCLYTRISWCNVLIVHVISKLQSLRLWCE